MAQAHQLRRAVRFGVFELDYRSGELRKSGIRIKLQEQPFRILARLLERPGEVVTRQELQAELWPDGTIVDFDHSLGSAINKLRAALSDSASNPRFVETLPRRGLRFIAPVEKTTIPQGVRRTGPPPDRSLAVLPFMNLSGDPEQAYFCDGMTDALTTDLASIGALRVVSRMSVTPFKDTDAPAPDIGRRLNVRHLVEGSVLRDRERVRITVQLIDSMKDLHVWANSYEGSVRDIIALQREVARAIAGEVKVKVTAREKDRLGAICPVNPEAHEAYLRGRFHHALWTNEGFRTALDYFQQAIDADPNYAPAYAGLAMAYRDMTVMGLCPGRETIPKATAAAEMAVRLDDQLPEAHFVIGCCRGLAWDWTGAEQKFHQALELNPGLSNPHHAYTCFVLLPQGRFEEAVLRQHRALELNPLSLEHKTTLVHVYYYMRRYDLAMEHLQDALRMAPEFPVNLVYLGTLLSAIGKHDDAIDAIQKANGIPNLSLPLLAHAYAVAGKREEALTALRGTIDLSKRSYVSPFFIAMAYAGLRKADQAIQWLETGWLDRDFWMLMLGVELRMDPIRADPRYGDLLKRMNLGS